MVPSWTPTEVCAENRSAMGIISNAKSASSANQSLIQGDLLQVREFLGCKKDSRALQLGTEQHISSNQENNIWTSQESCSTESETNVNYKLYIYNIFLGFCWSVSILLQFLIYELGPPCVCIDEVQQQDELFKGDVLRFSGNLQGQQWPQHAYLRYQG